MYVHQGSEKPRVFKKAQPTGFLGAYWVFQIVLFERAVGKLVGWFSSSAKLFCQYLGYLKICKFILLVVRSCKHKEIFNYYGHDRLKFNLVWCGFFNRFYPKNHQPGGYCRGVWTLVCMCVCVLLFSSLWHILWFTVVHYIQNIHNSMHNVAAAGGASHLYSWSRYCWHKWCFIVPSDHSSEAGRKT